jgi:hypothetical protein
MHMKREEDRNGVTAGLLLIGIGILIYTNWWWPGIMYVLGVSISSGLAFRGRFVSALVMLIVFLGIPVLTQIRGLPWNMAAPAVLIILGLLILARSLLFREKESHKDVSRFKEQGSRSIIITKNLTGRSL